MSSRRLLMGEGRRPVTGAAAPGQTTTPAAAAAAPAQPAVPPAAERVVGSVTVIDYGLGNLHSVLKGLAKAGIAAEVADGAEGIARAERLILPGVGAFADGMAGLTRRGQIPALRAAAAAGVPLLGICLGMQLLFDSSEEFGLHQGLGFIPGTVTRIPSGADAARVKVPHVGWNRLVPPAGRDWSGSFLAATAPGAWAYFVHSFRAEPRAEQDLLAACTYGPHRIAAAVRRRNIAGCQYHPEKSGEAGLAMLAAFGSSPSPVRPAAAAAATT